MYNYNNFPNSLFKFFSEGIGTLRKAVRGARMFDKRLKLYHQILDNIADGVYFVTLDRKIVFWNKGAESITGYSSAEAVGRACYDDFLNHEDEKGHALCDAGCPIVIIPETKKPLQRNLFLRKKDGEKLLVEEHVSPLYRGGKLEGVIITFRDISLFTGLRPFQLRVRRWRGSSPYAAGARKSVMTMMSGNSWRHFSPTRGWEILPIQCVPSVLKRSFRKRYIWRVTRISARR
jgi:PAS domain S-box-containing protein